MANYVLKDTGYANTSGAGTQETVANSGNALNLNVEGITWNQETGTADQANPGRYEYTEVNFASIQNPPLVVKGVLDVADANYETDLKALNDMCITRGLKHFYYTSNSDGFKPLSQVFGSVTHGSLQVDGTLKSLLVRCVSFRFDEQGKTFATKGLRRYTITLKITNPND